MRRVLVVVTLALVAVSGCKTVYNSTLDIAHSVMSSGPNSDERHHGQVTPPPAEMLGSPQHVD